MNDFQKLKKSFQTHLKVNPINQKWKSKSIIEQNKRQMVHIVNLKSRVISKI